MFRGTLKNISHQTRKAKFAFASLACAIFIYSAPAFADLSEIQKKYKYGDINDETYWSLLGEQVHTQKNNSDIALLQQARASFLDSKNIPWLAAKFAILALQNSEQNKGAARANQDLSPSWRVLQNSATKIYIDDLIVSLAESNPNLGSNAKFKDWDYFQAKTYEKNGNVDRAKSLYAQIKPTSSYYMLAQYQLGMILYEHESKLEDAIVHFRKLTGEEFLELVIIEDRRKLEILDLVYLALGRIQFERLKFESAANYYRQVSRKSRWFYDALFEQAWAYFMAGLPNHSLGALHAVSSPTFDSRFNPESSLLRAMVYYWMCRYDDAGQAIKEFDKSYSTSVAGYGKWLKNNTFTLEKSYRLFEDLLGNVSSESLGVDRGLLISANKSPSMAQAREQLATVLDAERSATLPEWSFLRSDPDVNRIIEDAKNSARKNIGDVLTRKLQALKSEYAQMAEQAEFLRVELLMSKKDQVLGKELHPDGKIRVNNVQLKTKSWGENDQTWGSSDKGEYWWDEMGFYVYRHQSMCKK